MANANTMTKISTVTVGSGGAATIDFTSIPATYTDIVIKYSGRSTAAGNYQNVNIKINTDTGSNYTSKLLYGDGSAAGSDTTTTTFLKFMYIPFSSATASVFGSGELYFAKYAGSIYKSMIADTVTENNLTGSGSSIIGLTAGLWSDNSAINAITLTPNSGSWAEYSTATLYGIKATTATTALATGGTITYNGGYVYHTFLSSGTFTPSQSLVADCLLVAGGGGGGRYSGGGGGAGGLYYSGSNLLTATGYTVTVGGGGIASQDAGSGLQAGGNGSNSTFTGLTAAVGGGGGGGDYGGAVAGKNGGSGGGGQGTGGTNYGVGTGSQGNFGSLGLPSGGADYGGGGGGAGAGTTTKNGGVGSSAYSSWGYATTTGQLVSGTYYYAGGGGGGGYGSPGSGGSGGGATGGNNSAGTVNTGGGAGGGSVNSGYNGGIGGSGIVIIRYQVQ